MKRGLNVLPPYFDLLLVLELIESEKGTFTLLVPTILEAVLNHPERNKYNLSTLKNVMSGGAKVDEQLASRVILEMGCGMSIVTGMTETSGPIVQTHREDSFKSQ